jgi:MFS family permease
MGLAIAARGIDAGAASRIVGAGLAGAACAALAATFGADRAGRRRFLVFLGALTAIGAVAFALAERSLAMAVLAFVGMLNGMGRDRGAALIIEQAMLPSCVSDHDRTRAFARYNIAQDVGHALGSLLAGLGDPGRAGEGGGGAALPFVLYALLAAAGTSFVLRLSPRVESPSARPGLRVSRASRGFLTKLSLLFGLDSLGGGFLTTALLSYVFVEHFHASGRAVAALFFGARVLNAVSHLGAAWLARRIGLVNTMVFTHVPSSLLLVTVAFAPSFPVAAVLFLLREGLVEMDVPTRQSYVQAIVRPEERMVASGVTHLVRLAGWALGPLLAGPLMSGGRLVAPLVAGAGLKILYDLLLYVAFRRVRPPEETT